MCGHFGIIPTRKRIKPQQLWRSQQLFGYLASLSQQRGSCATGRALIYPDGSINLYKRATPARAIQGDPNWYDGFNRKDIVWWMGHTRAATCGPNTDANAHPFVFERTEYPLVGCHNGGVYNHYQFDTVSEVDSANFLSAVSQVNPEKWPKLLSYIQGWFAFVWYAHPYIVMVKDKGTPLYVAYTHTLKAWVYASTEEILRSAMVFAGVDIASMQPLPSETIVRIIPQTNDVKLERISHYFQGGLNAV